MKSISRYFIMSLTIIGIVILYSTCNKDTDCDAVITVKMQSDTNIIVPNATVKIHKEDVYVEGVSDANGQFRHTFKLEAILDVDAKVPGTPPDTLYGQTVIRLKPGKTVYKSVFVN
jgi:hypothetical protein